MAAGTRSSGLDVGWADDALSWRVRVGGDGVARLCYVCAATLDPLAKGAPNDDRASSPGTAPTGLHLVDAIVSGSGRTWSGRRYVESVVGQRLLYASHERRTDGPWREVQFCLRDPCSGLRAVVFYRFLENSGVLRSWARLINCGVAPMTIESVTSFLGSGLAGPVGGNLDDVDVMWAENNWLGEGRWQIRPFRDALPDLNRSAHQARSRARLGFTSAGGWSSGTYLPMGAAVNRRTGHTWVWQIEHNGGWHWQVGEHTGCDAVLGSQDGHPGSYLALLGPTDAEHHWRLRLPPGGSFETVPVAVAFSNSGFEEGVARLTGYRRAIRRPHPDHRLLPVIFNDYMNTLMGDPTTERLLPLVEAAARAGAEYFCIDAGWYAELGEAWWNAGGAWEPSATRFPNGLRELLDRIRALGMVPGLWIEPEIVGVRSAMTDRLPPQAFFARNGERVVEEQGRYHLDFSHPLVVAHLDRVVDFLVGDLGVGYLKIDYNINVDPGTDSEDGSPGVGMLAHNRAFLAWLDRVLDRYPALTIENCASGGMRTDYALLSRCQVQSTSDQQDFLRYPPIATAAPVAIAPEQAAIWAYPQPEWDDDEIVFTLCSALLGRVHLSGHIDKMSPAQFQLVAEAIRVYKQLREDLAIAVPFWPLGLPGWTDPWVALGMRARNTYLIVWHRNRFGDGLGEHREASSLEIALPVAHLRDRPALAKVLYAACGDTTVEWSAPQAKLSISLPRSPFACLVALVTV